MRWPQRTTQFGPSTLRGRITLIATAVTAAWVVALTIGFDLALVAQLEQQASTVLRVRAEAVASTVEVAASGEILIREVRDDAASDVGTWVFRGSEVLEAPARSGSLDAAAAALADTGERQTTTTVGTGTVQLFALPVIDGGQQVATVVTSTSLAPFQQTARLAIVASAMLVLLLIFGIYLVVRLSTQRALEPVQQMIAQAGRWSADDVERRFGPATRPAELEELAQHLDALLDRIAAVLRHEQVFTAQVSHELRTPLAAIVAETSLLVSRPRSTAELVAGVQEVSVAAHRAGEILDTLLQTARSAGRSAPGRADVAVVLDRLAAGWSAAAALQVGVEPGTVVGVDEAVVERLLAPLLANAARYARSSISVTAGQAGHQVDIVVRDDGPGISPEDVEAVFQPGWRANPTDGHDGAGLGLALVRRLATAAGGSVRSVVGPTQTGAVVVVSLPRA